jgi:RNA polymerase sigma-70 factor (ECF subfamily)
MRERDAPPPHPLSIAEFTALVDRHQRALHAFLRGWTAHEEHARDLLQETFCAAWRVAQRGAPPFVAGCPDEEARRWLFHTAYCQAVSALRRRKLIQWEPLDELSAPWEAGSLPTFEESIAEGEALRAALAQLSPDDVACLLLRVAHGFSAAEVGAIMGASAEVINKRLSRAKQRLRAAYLAQDAQPVEERSRR